MKKINVTCLERLKWEVSPSGSVLLTDESSNQLVDTEEFFRGALLQVIDDAVGPDWKIELREIPTKLSDRRYFEADIVAPDVASYLLIVDILKERSTDAYIIVGRDTECIGTKYSFHAVDHSILHPFLTYDSFKNLPSSLLFAALIC